MLLRSNDGDLYLWCPYDRDPRTGETVHPRLELVRLAVLIGGSAYLAHLVRDAFTAKSLPLI